MVKYKYAIDDVGEVIDIETVDKEATICYLCIGCGQELVPKIGEKRQRHFAHKANTINCSKETYLHKLSKEKLYRYLRFCIINNIPFHLKYDREICLHFDDLICNSFKSQKEYNLLGYYQNVFSEKSFDDLIPDILLESNNKKNQLFIEIAVSHESSQKKKDKNKMIEIKIENEKDIFDVIENGINENDERITLFNFNQRILESEHCDENHCANYIDCLQITKKVIKRYKVFVFQELRKNGSIRIHKIPEKENNITKIQKYLNNYSKKNIKTVSFCKYYSGNSEFNRFLLIELKA